MKKLHTIKWLKGGEDNSMGFITEFITFSVGVLIVMLLILLPINRMIINGEIAEFKSVENTLYNARTDKKISNFEIAAIQQKVVDNNRWLASNKFYNSIPIIEWYIPDEVDNLEPIK